jgi:cation:H+ antiporter
MELSFLIALLGLGLLWVGSELMVRSIHIISQHYKISHSVLGLTIVAAGTSIPELFTNIVARVQNASDAVVFGSILGSNSANIALVLATAALIKPFKFAQYIKQSHLPIVCITTLLFALLFTQHMANRIDGAVLCLIGVIAFWALLKKSPPAAHPEIRHKKVKVFFSFLITLISLVLVLYGAHVFLDGALRIAEHFKVSARVISLTLIAVGTSLPEWATAIVSSLRRKYDLAISLVLGSNLFNLFIITGVSALVRPFLIEKIFLYFDFSVMVFLTLLLWLFSRAKVMYRSFGLAFFLLYVGYIFCLFYYPQL